MAGVLGSAVVQEAISRVSSIIFNRSDEKRSREHSIERLEIAHAELELAIERSGKLPITDVSLLRRRKILKRAFRECSDVLHRCKHPAQEGEEANGGLTLTHSSFPKRIAYATKSSIAYFFTREKDDLYCSDVRRFEWFADCADKFVRDVEYGCSLRHHTFSNPLLRQLLEGKTLRYERMHGSWRRDLYIWPICLEGRGVEAELSYHYEDYKMPEKSFRLRFILRLSESTDLVGIAIKCLQYLASQFKMVTDTAIGELTLLCDLDDISHSYDPPWFGVEDLYACLTQLWRPDPMCCKPNGNETACSRNIISSDLSYLSLEQVITICFQCYASALECNLHGSAGEVSGNNLIDLPRPLLLRAGFVPHGMWDDIARNYGIKSFESKRDCRDGNVGQEIEMVKSKTIDRLINQPELACYTTLWQYAHGFAFFNVKISTPERLMCPFPTGYNGSSMAQRVITQRG